MRAAIEADAEAWVLSTLEGAALLAEVGRVAAPGAVELTRWRKIASADRVSAAVRLAAGRRRGAAKFSRAEGMWFHPTGLEQATAEAVAVHKAERFAGKLVVDLCSGIGGDAVAIARATHRGVLAVDSDHGMARRTLWNARVYDVADRVAAVRARAESIAMPAGAWVHIDPDRRTSGRRSRDLSGYRPDLVFLESLLRTTPGGAIKLGPASDFFTHFGAEGVEVELVSLNGECKEATVWFGAAATCRRRATKLPAGVTCTDENVPGGQYAAAGPVLDWVFDPDSALIRSGLLDGFAVANGLTRIADGADYLTGPRRVISPFLAAFEVVSSLPLDLKRVKHEVAVHGFGSVDVKTRGVALCPEVVRARINARGSQPGVLLLVGGQGKALAVLAKRRP